MSIVNKILKESTEHDFIVNEFCTWMDTNGLLTSFEDDDIDYYFSMFAKRKKISNVLSTELKSSIIQELKLRGMYVDDGNTIVEGILKEGLLHEEKIVGFQNVNYGNFVVLMGSPGAGKTFVAQNLLNLRGFKHLAGDNWLEMVAKKDNIDLKDPEQTAALNDKLEDKFKKFRTNFITQQLKSQRPVNAVVDITGKSVISVRKALDVVEDSYYVTTLIYVVTSKEECIKRNLSRARTVPVDFLMSVYNDIQETYTQVFSLFDNVWMITNDELWSAFEGTEEYVVIDGKKYLKARSGQYSRPVGRILRIK